MIKGLLLENDPIVNQTNYYSFNNIFSEEEITWIENLSKLYDYTKGEIIGEDDGSIRKSKIKWIHHNEKSNWLYEKIVNLTKIANESLWKFDLHGIVDSIQYTEYEEDGGHYDWHMDIGPNSINHRKISIVVQLTNPDEYDGGELMIWNSQSPTIVDKGLGNIIIFPSFLMHKVTPMQRGTRKSLVLWIGGGSYK